MIVLATNAEHRARYIVYLDGVDISEVVMKADDVAHEVIVTIRDAAGQVLRMADNRPLRATVRGRVHIVPRIGIPSVLSAEVA